MELVDGSECVLIAATENDDLNATVETFAIHLVPTPGYPVVLTSSTTVVDIVEKPSLTVPPCLTVIEGDVVVFCFSVEVYSSLRPYPVTVKVFDESITTSEC